MPKNHPISLMSSMREWSKRIFARSQILQVMPYLSSSLYSRCLSCSSDVCVRACPEGVVFLDPDHIANLTFLESGCVFCQECVRACFGIHGEHDGFDLGREEVNVQAKINPLKCLAWNGSICSSCKDACLCEIGFAGMLYPEVIDCNGCGLCVSRCPTDAIEIKPKQKEQK